MIIQETTTPFGGRLTDIKTPQFVCVVTTAKEGIFQGLSTMVVLVVNSDAIPVAKILYNSYVSKGDRYMLHGEVCKSINKHGEDGYDITEATHMLLTEMTLKKEVKECQKNIL